MSTDIPDLIAGALGVSRGTAYDMMREALAEQESWEDLHNALQRIDTAAVGLPNFKIRHEGGLDAVTQNIVDAIVALHEQPAQQEPWGACVYGRVFVGRLPEHARKFSEDKGVPIQWLYTSPPAQRTWVGLTDEEKNQVAWSCGAMSADWLEFAEAIEAKLKEKNT